MPKKQKDTEVKIRLPGPGQLSGAVISVHGEHFKVLCEDGSLRSCKVKGKMWKRIWIYPDDIVIVEPWTFQTKADKGNIIWKYTPTHAAKLRERGHLQKLDNVLETYTHAY
jgi:translation initiation factor 1A